MLLKCVSTALLVLLYGHHLYLSSMGLALSIRDSQHRLAGARGCTAGNGHTTSLREGISTTKVGVPPPPSEKGYQHQGKCLIRDINH